MRNLYTLVTLASIIFSTLSAEAVNNRGFRPDMSFMDFEDITEYFHPKHKQTVHIIKHKDSPLEITKAEVSDRGTVFFSGLSGVKNTYSVNVKNNSGRKILAYEVTWVLKHPFEDYVFHKIHSNSIDPVKVDGIQTLKFRRSKHYRDDAYYYVEISKVEFDDDESIWEAPELKSFNQHSRLDAVKEQIDAMGDEGNLDVIDQETLDALKEKYSDLEEDGEEEDDLKDRVELQEIKTKTIIKTEPVAVEETKPTVTETKKTSIETKTTEVITTEETIEPITDPEPILDPQKLMQAVDELLKSNAVLESDLVETTTTVESAPVTETKIIETTEIIPEPEIIKTTSPITETTIIETKPTVQTTTTQVIQTKELQSSEDDDEFDYEDDDEIDFDDDDDDFDFDDDDDFDFEDDDY